MKIKGFIIALLCFLMISLPVCAEGQTVYYVSPDGTAPVNTSSLENPTSFSKVKYKINTAGAGNYLIYLLPGEYPFSDTISFNRVDSADGSKVISFCAYEKDTAIFTGGVSFNISDTYEVSENMKEKFSSEEANIRELPLSEINVTAGNISDYVALELTGGDKALRLARYPNVNDAMLKIEGANYSDVSENVSIKVSDDRIYSWSNPTEIKAEIPLKYYWSWTKHSVSSFDMENKIVNFSTKNNSHIATLNQQFYFYNIIEELDEEGEYYIDRENNILYFYPYENIDEYTVSTLATSLVNLENVKNMTFTDIIFENTKGEAAIELSGCENVVFSGCSVKNVMGNGITLDSQCKNILIENCEIKNIGGTGIIISGGDSDTLVRGENIVDNCVIINCGITSKTGRYGVNLSGCGNTVKNSKLSNFPEDAIRYSGNDNLIDNNEISYACLYASDAGAVYAGRSWKTRGNEITNNFFHDIYGIFGTGAHCIYFDDGLGGETIEENLFAYCGSGVFVHGGRDNKLNNNKFFNCNNSLTVLNISNLASFNADDYMSDVPATELWLNHYEELSALKEEYYSNDETIGYPKNNEATGNILFNTPDITFSDYALSYGGVLNNNISFLAGLYR